MRWLKVYRVQGTEFRLQNSGFWLLASGFWLLNSGSRLLGSGFTRAGEIQQQGGSAFRITLATASQLGQSPGHRGGTNVVWARTLARNQTGSQRCLG